MKEPEKPVTQCDKRKCNSLVYRRLLVFIREKNVTGAILGGIGTPNRHLHATKTVSYSDFSVF